MMGYEMPNKSRKQLEQELAEEKKWKEEDPRMLREQIRIADSAFNRQHAELTVARQEIAAVIQAIVTAEKATGDCSDVLDVVQVFIEHHKEVECQRDALQFQRPYDTYWSRRALAAERDLAALKEGLGVP